MLKTKEKQRPKLRSDIDRRIKSTVKIATGILTKIFNEMYIIGKNFSRIGKMIFYMEIIKSKRKTKEPENCKMAEGFIDVVRYNLESRVRD